MNLQPFTLALVVILLDAELYLPQQLWYRCKWLNNYGGKYPLKYKLGDLNHKIQ